jgi:drug/metabolite transporter (DMT)-like permease
MAVDRTSIEERQQTFGVLAVGVIILGTNAILVRWSGAPSLIKGFYRLLFTVCILALPTVVWYREELRALVKGGDVVRIAAAGVALAVNTWSFFESLEWTSVAAAVVLGQTQVVFVGLGGYLLLGEQLTVRKAGGMGLALCGVAVMSITGLLDASLFAGGAPLYGNVLAMLAGASFAGYLLTGRSVRQRVTLLPYVSVVYAISAAVLLLIALFEGVTVALSAYPHREILLFVAMAVGPGVFGHSLLNWALERLESNVVSVAALGIPLVSTLLAALLLAEIPGPATVIGGTLVLVGIYITAS